MNANMLSDSSSSPPASSSRFSSWFKSFWSSALRSKPLTCSVPLERVGGLVRRLGLLDLIFIGLGCTIGAGIFVISGTAAREAGPGVAVSFLLAGFSCLLNALCYAELSSCLPAVVGGAYMYSYAAFNELTAFLIFAQFIFDSHISSATIARSLASYLVMLLNIFPFFKENWPGWMDPGGVELFGGILSVNLLAPILVLVMTLILCQGLRELTVLNSFMTVTKVLIVLLVISFGAFKVDISNWSPFAPNGYKAIITGSTVVAYAYNGYDAITSSAEESKRPQRDLPLGMLVCVLSCVVLYIGVCLVITGMVSYKSLGVDAPLAEAFAAKGLKFFSVVISTGAVAGLTTSLLGQIYATSRVYVGLGRDGLLPSFFAKVHPTRHIPNHSQVWVGTIAGIMSGFFDVHRLSHILSVGGLASSSIVSACVVTLRLKHKDTRLAYMMGITTYQKGVICLLGVASCGFLAGLSCQSNVSSISILAVVVMAVLFAIVLHYNEEFTEPSGFSCPGVPFVPLVCIFFNLFLFAQLHWEAWVRFVVVNIVSIGIYAVYGQHHANVAASDLQSIPYHKLPSGESQ
ncbi:cationic amino acid transporter 9, chloroplastic isoform X1 [Amborella trichopoda]|uniref:Cationic amino acid transporter C-terminal domain-containing protein n=2 Tax=Amborella trichopoda TaxID=13333 RepID=W1NY69_AMBTC|nr:cationic amino acid transporter 9, chloroplastic isoform X1 [Amborella trichopoda]ERN00206.1 hypothetical protein AMTR_s00111p00098200 [Amborella trichopoda]|eukprot:XP_006837352.3 cationic amino acid transporter 9, chloroplastic isoform X1 [Amborella trichopoda]